MSPISSSFRSSRAMCGSGSRCCSPCGCSASRGPTRSSPSTITATARWPRCRCGFRRSFFIVVSDFLLYWNHRAFHRGILWKYHAVHHASDGSRMDQRLALSSVQPDARHRWRSTCCCCWPACRPTSFCSSGRSTPRPRRWCTPISNWTFGPLKRIVASPVFHRWHHTLPEEGGEKNFAGTFSLWDWMFGTLLYAAKASGRRRTASTTRNFPKVSGCNSSIRSCDSCSERRRFHLVGSVRARAQRKAL